MTVSVLSNVAHLPSATEAKAKLKKRED